MRSTFALAAAVAALSSVSLAQDDTYTYPHCVDDKQVVVQMFEWSWDAIARECEDVLGPKGFCGVQISPPAEHIYENGEWWIRYQHVSYALESRSGGRDEFADMVGRCAAVGVNIYADVVFNQMAAGSGQGTAGNSFDSGAKSYPAVPYSGYDFHSDCPIDYDDADSVRNCPLLGMPDLDQGSDYVRERIAEYLNDLLSLGVMGFRVDAAKHMWPQDLVAIVNMLDDDKDGNRPFVYQEVIDYGTEPVTMEEYFDSGRVTEFNYGQGISNCIWNKRDWNCLAGFGEGWGLIPDQWSLAFIDNHDNQRGGGIIYHDDGYNGYEYRLANAYHLGHVYGFKRIMSSYYFSGNYDMGPPSSDPQDGCGSDWVCEHRWPSILNLVQFANACAGLDMLNYEIQNGDVVGWARGEVGFVVIGEAQGNSFYTGLPDGDYCDLISECAQTVTVSGGYGTFTKFDGGEPVVAICVGCS